MIVVDTNVVAYHLLRTVPSAEETTRLADHEPDWVAPLLLQSELRNVLTLAHRERSLSLQDAKDLFRQAETLFENALFDVDSASVFDLTAQTEMSAYDCEYVELAQRLDIPFITYDNEITNAVPSIASSPSTFLEG